MPEATLLYSVVAAVIAGLVIWVAIVLAKTTEKWSRPHLAPAGPTPELDVEPPPPAAAAEEAAVSEPEEKKPD